MTRLKTYEVSGSLTLLSAELRDHLGPARRSLRCVIRAESKTAAVVLAEQRRAARVQIGDLRLSGRDRDVAALAEAGILAEGPMVLLQETYGPQRGVFLMRADGFAYVGDLALSGGGLYDTVFRPSAARWAGVGSIAAGRARIYYKVGRDHWAAMSGGSRSDEDVQIDLDLGNVDIIRAGYGDRHQGGGA